MKKPDDSPPVRALLRREKLAAREALPTAEHQRLSAALGAHLEAFLARREPGVLGFCWPMRGEFDLLPLAPHLLAAGWRLALPVVITPNAPLAFRAWTPATAMSKDRYGIPSPLDGDWLTPDVLLLPLVAFDDAGYRLGYGGGYFDRTLAALVPSPLAVGVGFELARTDSIAPEPHDMRLDAIVTEAGVMETRL